MEHKVRVTHYVTLKIDPQTTNTNKILSYRFGSLISQSFLKMGESQKTFNRDGPFLKPISESSRRAVLNFCHSFS
jgi:hypothetical protein